MLLECSWRRATLRDVDFARVLDKVSNAYQKTVKAIEFC